MNQPPIQPPHAEPPQAEPPLGQIAKPADALGLAPVGPRAFPAAHSSPVKKVFTIAVLIWAALVLAIFAWTMATMWWAEADHWSFRRIFFLGGLLAMFRVAVVSIPVVALAAIAVAVAAIKQRHQ